MHRFKIRYLDMFWCYEVVVIRNDDAGRVRAKRDIRDPEYFHSTIFMFDTGKSTEGSHCDENLRMLSHDA